MFSLVPRWPEDDFIWFWMVGGRVNVKAERDIRLTRLDFKVLCVVGWHVDPDVPDDECLALINDEDLVRESGFKPSTVRRSIKKLEDLRYLLPVSDGWRLGDG